MADRSPGKPPPGGGDGKKDHKGRGREVQKRSLRDRVSFFETVWWGRNRSPSIERAEEAVASPKKKETKLRRKASVSPDRKSGTKVEEQKSCEEWEWVENDGDGSLADIIEKRIEERKRHTSGSNTPITKWQKASDDEDRSSLAQDIERRLERHREEVRIRLSSPQSDWLSQSPLRRSSSRDDSPSKDSKHFRSFGSTQSLHGSRDYLDTSGKRSLDGSKEDIRGPNKKVVRQIISKAEHEDGKISADVVTITTSSSWGGEKDASPVTEIRRSREVLDEDSPSSQDGNYFSLEEEEKESLERGRGRRYEKRFVRKSVEKTVERTPLVSVLNSSQISITSDDGVSPLNSPIQEEPQTIRGRHTSGPRSRIGSRTPSVERILEEEESMSFGTETEDSLLVSTSPTQSMVDSGDHLSMETISSIKLEKTGTSGEVRKFSTKVTIREHSPSPAYSKYVLSSRALSKDSLLSSNSFEETVTTQAPPWVTHKSKDEDEKEGRGSYYQEHISIMRGK